MKTVFLLLIYLSFMIPDVATGVESKQKLILNSTVSIPFHTPQQTGCFDLYYKKLFSQLDIDIEIVDFPAKRALELANKGEIDGDIIRFSGFESEYPNLLKVPVPVYNSKVVLISFEPIVDSVDSILRDEKVGMVLSSGITERWVIKKNQVIARDYIQLVSLVKAQRIRYAFIPLGVLYGVDKSTKEKLFKKFLDGGVGLNAFLFLHKKHRELIPKLTKIMSRPENLDGDISNACIEFREKIKQQYPL